MSEVTTHHRRTYPDGLLPREWQTTHFVHGGQADQELREAVWAQRRRRIRRRGAFVLYWALFAAAIIFTVWAAAAHGADDCCPPGSNCPTTPAWQASPIGVAPIPKTQVVVRGVTNVCRVRNYLTICPTCKGGDNGCHHGGSGVLVYSDAKAGFAQVVTVAHLFSEGRGRIVVQFEHRHMMDSFEATIQHIDPTWDFCVLRIACPSGIRPVRIATTNPAVGVRLYAGGFPRGGQFRWVAGRFRGWVGMKGHSKRRLLNMHARALSGQSGGPIADASGTLVGIISHSGCGDVRCRGCDKSGPEALTVGPSIVVIRPHIGPPKQDQHTRPPEPAGRLPVVRDVAPPGLRGHPTTCKGHHPQIAELRAEIAVLSKRVKTLESRPDFITIWYRRGDGEIAQSQVPLGGRYELQPWYLRTEYIGTDEVTIEAIPPGEGFTIRLHPHE